MRPPFTACPDDILHFPQRTNPAVEGTTAAYSGQAKACGACWKPAVAQPRKAWKALLCLSVLLSSPLLSNRDQNSLAAMRQDNGSRKKFFTGTGAPREEQLPKKLTDHISRSGVKEALRQKVLNYPTLQLRTFISNFSPSHLLKTPSLTGRVLICWKTSVLMFCTCSSACSNTIIGPASPLLGKAGTMKSDEGDNIR